MRKMLLHCLISFGLASFCLALPTLDLENAAEVYKTDTLNDENGVEKRYTQVISKDIHDELIYYSEYAAAAYCPPQQGKTGDKVACSPAQTCGRVEKSDTKIYSSWLK
jgi:hypothetical protein